MAFSLSGWFKGKNGPDEPDADKPSITKSAAPGKGPALTRPVPSSVRKAVPNSVQPVSLRDPSSRGPARLPAGVPPPGPAQSMRVTATVPPRRISFGNPAATAAAHPRVPEPTPVAAVPEPANEPATVPEVAVILEVGDFVDRLPASLLAGGALDRGRTVEFSSTELFSDLAKGRASVPASVLYEKCPELFAHPISAMKDVEVTLPLAKLVEQLAPALQTRADQVAEENVGEIETPFLQVAMEDNARLPAANGTKTGAIQPAIPLPTASSAADIPPRPAHRTGQIQTITIPRTVPALEPPAIAAPPTATGPINASKRPPSTVRASVAGGKIRLSGPSVPTRMSLQPGAAVRPPEAPGGIPPVTANDLPPSATQRIASPIEAVTPAANSPSHLVTKKTQRIQIPPISLRGVAGAPPAAPGRPAIASVPMQPSPVTVRPNGAIPQAPELINFRSSPPPPTARPLPQSFVPPPIRPSLPPTVAPETPAASAPIPAVKADERTVILGLAAILRGLSPTLLAVESSSVPDDVKLELPFAAIEPQLSTGRVFVPSATFAAALPEQYRGVLDPAAELSEVPLPLQEVFQNLPADALQVRHDQVTEEISHLYPTPFADKAQEDALRLGVAEAPVAGSATPTAAPVDAPTGDQLSLDRPIPADEPATAETPADPEPVQHRDIPFAPEQKTEAPALEAKIELPALAEVPATPFAAEPAAEAAAEPAPETVVATNSARPLPVIAKGKDSELQVLFMTEEELDAKAVVKLVSQMPGLDGCTVMFGDGLRLAGNFPGVSETEGFSAMAPPFFKRARNFATETGLGSLASFTLHTDSSPVSFLMHDDICLAVRHANRGFMPGVREKLEIVVRELARMYS